MTARAYIVRDQKAALFWSHKAGCTSLVQWLVLGYLGLTPAQIKKAGALDARNYLTINDFSPEHAELMSLVQDEGYEAIILARNPAQRVLSAYVNKFVQYAGKWLTSFEDLEPLAQMQLKRWNAGFDADGNYVGITFREFLTNVEATLKQDGGSDENLDPHWGFQVSKQARGEGLQFDKVLCLEDFSNAIAWLNERFGIFYREPQTNRTRYEQKQTVENIFDQTAVSLAEQEASLGKELFLTPEMMTLIARIYADDYQAFGYDPADYRKIPDNVRAEGQALLNRQNLVGQAYLDQGGEELPYEIHDNGSDRTVVAFGGLGLELGMPVFEFRKALQDIDCNWVFFKDVHRSWYHAPLGGFGRTFEDKTKNIRAILGRLAETDIYTLGSSAGGFGALMFAPFLNAKASLLFGPQVFIDQNTRTMLNDNRWNRLIHRIGGSKFLSVREIADKVDFPVHIVIGNGDQMDILHALYATRYVDAKVSVLGRGSHNPAKELKTAGVLDEVLADFMAGRDLKEYTKLRIGQRFAGLHALKL